MDKKQKEALVLALYEKGEPYREITKKAGVSPNTIKAIVNRAGLDESTSIHSRAFELFSEGKTPLQVAIALNLEADQAIQYHQEYFMLLGCTEFTKVYLLIKDNAMRYVDLVKLIQDAGIGDGEVLELLRIANGHLPRVRLEYDRLKAELNSIEDQKSNSASVYHQLCNEISDMKTTVDQLQLIIKESKEEKAKLEMHKIRLQNFVKDFQDNNIEYSKVKQAIKEQIEYVMADRRQLLMMTIQSVIELLRSDPQKFHAFYYNRSTIPNDEEPILVEVEKIHQKIFENITNGVVTNLSDNISSTSSPAQKETSEQNSNDMRTSSDYLHAKEECNFSDAEDKEVERNMFKERSELPPSHRMISFPYRGQARHPNFDAGV